MGSVQTSNDAATKVPIGLALRLAELFPGAKVVNAHSLGVDGLGDAAEPPLEHAQLVGAVLIEGALRGCG